MHTIPYIDLNDLNLDWLLSNMKRIVSEWAAYQVSMGNKFDSLAAAYKALHDWIDGYFRNLNVQDQINNKLDAMAASGELLEIIRPTVISAADTWLAGHISNPASPPLDTSLSLANAAAPAKTVGDKAFLFRQGLYTPVDPPVAGTLYDANDAKVIGWYIIPYSEHPDNIPETENGYRFILVYPNSNASFIHQMYINGTSHTVFHRMYYSSSWTNWLSPVSGMLDTALTSTTKAAQAKATGDRFDNIELNAFTWKQELSGNVDLDDLYKPGWYIIQYGATPTHAPEDATNKHRYVLIFTTSSPTAGGFKHMIYINREDSTAYIRMMTNGSWDAWTTPMADQIYAQKEELLWHSRALGTLYNYNLNDVSLPGWYNIATGSVLTGTLPPDEATSGGRRQLWVTAVPPDRTQRFMIYFNYSTGLVAWRIYYGGSWTDWYLIKQADNKEKEIYRTPDYFTEPIDFAHRGVYLGGLAPQNTLPAFRLAVTMGYNGVETDVQITSDNVPVIIHDRNIATTARTPDNQPITDPTYIDQITYAQTQEYDFGIRISAEFAGTKLMTLKDLLAFCRRTKITPILHLKETITAAKFEYIKQDLIDTSMMYDAILMQGNKTTMGQMAAYFEKCMLCLAGNSSDFGSEIPGLFKSWRKNGNVLFFLGGSTFYADSTRGPIVQQIIEDGVIPISVFAQTSSVDTAPNWVYLSLVNPADNQVPYFHPKTILYNKEMGIVQ